MEKFIKNSILNIFIISLVFVLAGPIVASAATDPGLGAAATFSILSQTTVTGTGTISGNVGNNSTGAAITALTTPMVSGTIYSTDGIAPSVASPLISALTVQADALAAYTTNIPGQGTNGTIVGALDGQIFTPGVYDQGAITLGGGTVTLNGAGIYIFRSASTLTSSGNFNLIGGARACDVYWRVQTLATISGGPFAGTILAGTGIHFTDAVTLNGRALGVGPTADVTLLGNTISGPTCAVAPVPVAGTCGTAATSYLSTDVAFSGTMCTLGNGVTTPASPVFPAAGNSVTWTCGGSNGGASSSTCTATRAAAPITTATLTLVKTVVGGTRTFADFPLTATGPTTITGNSAATSVTNATVTAGSYTLSEEAQSDYTAGSWSCIKNIDPAVVGSSITLVSGDSAICTIQNTYITPVAPSGRGGGGNSYGISTPVAPLISVVKVPSPLALPAGPGLVQYTYTVSNIGVVPMSKVTVTDDSCSPLVMVSGDTTANAILQVNGRWTYNCSTTLSATHTNTVTATGWANGVSSIDIANATVIVGSSTIPPLIHVTKVPNPLALSVGGGMVTYTNNVTNPGTVPLNNVQIVDDKCASVKYVSGDTNGDSKLDPSETWTYTCSAKLTKTTTNTVVATGQANGLTARDFAIATVVVAAPALPNTGFPPKENNSLWSIVMIAGILLLISVSVVVVIKKRTI